MLSMRFLNHELVGVLVEMWSAVNTDIPTGIPPFQVPLETNDCVPAQIVLPSELETLSIVFFLILYLFKTYIM